MAEEKVSRMKTIGDLLTRDLSRKIEEIIQVDQADEQSVHDEITEYVATDSIREQYHDLLRAVAEAPGDPHESVGVWVSGFFGSGKSSFAKNLGYALENRKVLGTKFGDLFKQQLDDRQINLSRPERTCEDSAWKSDTHTIKRGFAILTSRLSNNTSRSNL